MRLLFHFGASLLLIGAVYPLVEIFDRWDAPGLTNDTEFAVYSFVFAICLVLMLCHVMSSGVLKLGFVSWWLVLNDTRLNPVETSHPSIFDVPPLFDLPLRI